MSGEQRTQGPEARVPQASMQWPGHNASVLEYSQLNRGTSGLRLASLKETFLPGKFQEAWQFDSDGTLHSPR